MTTKPQEDYSHLRPSDPRRLEALAKPHDRNAVAYELAEAMGIDLDYFSSRDGLRYFVAAELRSYGQIISAYEAHTGWRFFDHKQPDLDGPVNGLLGRVAKTLFDLEHESSDPIAQIEQELTWGRIMQVYGHSSWDVAFIDLMKQIDDDPLDPDAAIDIATERIAERIETYGPHLVIARPSYL